MSRFRNQRGQALILMLLFLGVMMALAAAVLDVGAWYRADRKLQATADAAALAGAHGLPDHQAEAMNVCAVNFPPDISEIEMAGFTLKPSRVVAPPTIVEAPVALETSLMQVIPVSPTRNVVLGEIVRFKARPEIVDPDKLRVQMYVDRDWRPGALAGVEPELALKLL